MVIKRIGKIAIGCFGIIVILIILGLIFSGVIIKKLVTSAVQDKTGIQVNMDDTNKNNLTYTDPKTGAKLNIGGNKIPDNFPSDFPIYPGSTVTSSLEGDGFWLSLTTNDELQTVVDYYQANLSKNGWDAKATTGSGSTNWSVTKGDLSGYTSISSKDNQTSIIIVLGNIQNQN